LFINIIKVIVELLLS